MIGDPDMIGHGGVSVQLDGGQYEQKSPTLSSPSWSESTPSPKVAPLQNSRRLRMTA